MKIFSIFLCFILSPVLFAQQIVTGRITDAADGTSVAGASVFIANTTIGTASDASGNYSFTVPGTGSFEIVVSHVSYQSVFRQIDAPQPRHHYDVALEINDLQEVIINAPKTYKQKDVDLFWRTILGEKPSKNGMQVLNPAKVYFYLNSDNVLKASCKEPIEIINHQMGYSIQYVLQSFEYDYRSKEFMYYGRPFFEELIPQNSRERDRWEKKRQEKYDVSFIHFIRALYNEKIHEEGFLLVNSEAVKNGVTIPVLSKDIMQKGQDVAVVTIVEPLLLICYAMPVNNQMIQESYGANSARDATYPLIELLPQRMVIYSDGSYSGVLKMVEHRNSIFGLSSRLPVEYRAGYSTLAQLSQNKQDASTLPSYGLEKAEANLSAQLETYPQEKIHLHTDRDLYLTGEKIWFKAYLVDAQTHLHASNSEYVYVELISPVDTLVNRIMITHTDASVNMEFHTDKNTYQIREKIVSTLSFPDSLFYTHSGHFSIAVTDDKDFTVDESTTILSSLLLSSELKGHIEHPALYLHDPVAMDMLMMTHGWRRYNIPEVIKGNPEYPKIPAQWFQELNGQVKSIVTNRPVAGSEIFIMMRGEDGGFGSTSTDTDGSFTVKDLLFPDSTSFFIQALDRNGRDNVKVEMKPESYPALKYAPRSPIVRLDSKDELTGVISFVKKAELLSNFTLPTSVRTIQLLSKELQTTGKSSGK